jgi:hypothetical protein
VDEDSSRVYTFPVTPGHGLIVPKRHIALFFKATREEQSTMLDLLAQMRQLLLKELNPDAFNIGINDGAAAGQTVMHITSTLSRAILATRMIRAAVCAGSCRRRRHTGRGNDGACSLHKIAHPVNSPAAHPRREHR